uniref:T-box domain-containing protein n=1 Tax=Timema tahoe TaxID=61484 RepID=A0A7R9IG73_9NEOP|nr:unnamed protein product [Timema tahoe]
MAVRASHRTFRACGCFQNAELLMDIVLLVLYVDVVTVAGGCSQHAKLLMDIVLLVLYLDVVIVAGECFQHAELLMDIVLLVLRMFPTCRVSFTGVRPEQRYAVLMDIVPVDNKRYRYAYHRSSWLVAGKADPPAPSRLYMHPDSPFTGEQLRKQVVSFEKVKLTNNEMDKHGHRCLIVCLFLMQLVLNSMHKYQPRIHLVKRHESQGNSPITDLEAEEFKTFIFPESVFTAVTAYQNQLVSWRYYTSLGKRSWLQIQRTWVRSSRLLSFCEAMGL